MDNVAYNRAVAKRKREMVERADMEKYDAMEQRGFKEKYFPRHRDSSEEARSDKYIGQRFKIVARVTPMGAFPMWVIEFDNGFRMAANRWEVLK